MAHDCFQPEDTAAVFEMAPGDPRRRAAMECPYCRVLLKSYDEFMRAEAEEGSRPEDTRRELADFLRERISGNAPARRVRPLAAGARLQRVLLPLAAVIVVGVGLARWHPWERDSTRVERSEAGDRLAGPVFVLGEDSVELRWDGLPSADSYLLVLMGEDLSELLRFGPQPATSVTVPLEELRILAPSGVVAWQVRALKAGQTLERSELSFMDLE